MVGQHGQQLCQKCLWEAMTARLFAENYSVAISDLQAPYVGQPRGYKFRDQPRHQRQIVACQEDPHQQSNMARLCWNSVDLQKFPIYTREVLRARKSHVELAREIGLRLGMLHIAAYIAGTLQQATRMCCTVSANNVSK